MKDFDDLWRISQFHSNLIRWESLTNILESRGIGSQLAANWLNQEVEKSWASHSKRNKGLPANLVQLIDEVNSWLKTGLGQ
jgi:hypothetical protein